MYSDRSIINYKSKCYFPHTGKNININRSDSARKNYLYGVFYKTLSS
ncbi:hypothetical protein EAVNNN508_02865 [Elizabethkingia anophelis]|nr:hypothetical protein EAVNVB490_00067 [Elizabethkingia anophelis]CAI9668910.1 hypothetical protein EAVNNN508_00067 [Elizabethkingia anophelis]CAI9675468.1 hypothetical protein EAVNVB490_02868 [Elizabethkingia anophelis]CAI9684914.1 hypothetical protein EAVNNN508_02865 [Elizabethkingia anophelis]